MSDVSIVSGKLEVVGPSTDKPDGSEYTYLRIAQKNGGTKLIKKVGVGQLVESYIRPGIEGDFYFVKLGRLGYILFAVKTIAGDMIYEENGFATWIKKMRWSAFVLLLLFLPLSFVGLLMGGYLGIVVPIGFIYVIWKLAVSFPKVLKESFLRGQLNQHRLGS
ncbi:hypothetical protein EI533_25250 [Pseudomonas donghuensis]|nr:hypothetical protein [Pseudomonas donghuensis]